MSDAISESPGFDTDIAVVGMAGRFPGARTALQFWRNLRDGVESVQTFSDEELIAAGVDAQTLADPNYVKAGAPLPDMELFDAPFFGFSPREASIMDPQHRHFLECAWEALENAGHVPERFDGSIGVFGGSGHNAYMPYHLLTNPKLMDSVGFFLVRHTGNDKDFLTTRVSYLLNLRGPSVNVQTACSTSLVAIHLGVQSLLNRECDMALAGGVTIELPHRQGYLFRDGEILSPDGHCHAFDADSQGTVFGSGVGIVVLRRLADALRDGDHVHAVIKGTAVNNDGAGKVGYLAPSVDGQAQAISEALAVSGVEPDTITYVEAHGTGTPVGDPIEIAALTQAFRQGTERSGFCGIGSVKSNIGHLDTAAGVASFIKVAMAMQHRELPASLHFAAPNPACDFDTSPFQVNAALRPWQPPAGVPRRAGVSSLGVGGTNAHVIVEEAPVVVSAPAARAWQLLVLSAKTASALDAGARALAEHLESEPGIELADAAYTLQVGRQAMKQRRVVVARSAAEAAAALSSKDSKEVFSAVAPERARSLAFMFAGGGAQYPAMGADLYRHEPVFRAAVDECLELLRQRTGAQIRDVLFPAAGDEKAAATRLEKPSLALPALMTIQVAQARLWMSWGIEPAAMIGHSMGEYTAAYLAGVFSLDDALALVELRGRLFETLPEGAMLSVSMPADELSALMSPELSIAAVNGPALCVAAGPVRAIDALQRQLEEREIDAVRVRISVAAHSAMLEPILQPFHDFLRGIAMQPPSLPFVSNLSGTWAGAEVADPAYWVRHLRQTVRFADGLSELLKDDSRILLEVGPGRTLSTLARQHPARPAAQPVFNALRHPDEKVDDQSFMLGVLGRLWASGAEVDWRRLHGDERRRRVPLPTYCFDHQRHWVEPGKLASAAAEVPKPTLDRKTDIADWFYRPVWKPAPLPATAMVSARVLAFVDGSGFGEAMVAAARAAGHDVVGVRHGAPGRRSGADEFVIEPGSDADLDSVFAALVAEGRVPQHIVHLASLTGAGNETPHAAGFDSLLQLAQAIGRADLAEPMRLLVVSDGLFSVAGEGGLRPAKATLLGPCKVIPREFEGLDCVCADVRLPPRGSWQEGRLIDDLLRELAAPAGADSVAWRGAQRWALGYEPARLEAPKTTPLRERGVYLITGGLGGVGLALAAHLASTVQAKLVLIGRHGLPPREQWASITDSALARRVRQVQGLEAAGAEVLVLAADVCDEAAMRAAARQARERFGAIHGVLHTAGVLDDGVIMLKQPASVAAVLAPKVQGTLALEAALDGAVLDFTLLFSSVSSFSGLAGQVDYAAANAFLDAYAHERAQRDGSLTIAVDWSAWAEVGMAAAMAQQLGIGPAGTPVGHALIERCLADNADERVYATNFSVHTHWLLDEHRVRGGEALIPGTGYLELVRVAAMLKPQAGVLELRDLTFLAPFVVHGDAPRELRIRLQGQAFAVTSPGEGGATTEHVRGRVGFVDGAASADLDLDAIQARCNVRAQSAAELAPSTHLAFGPRWANIRRIAYGGTEALLALELPEAFESDLDAFQLHPALMDMATAGAQALIPGHADAFYVPASYGAVRVHAPLTRCLASHVRYRGDEGGDLAVFDVTVCDDRGRVLVDIDEFTMLRVRDKALLAAPAAAPAAHAHAHATANPVLAIGLRDGIRVAEGAAALERIVAAGAGPQVIVCPQDLNALVAALRAPAQPAAPAAAAPTAPARDVAPLEAALAAHEAVHEAAALAQGERIVAFVVYDPGHSVTVSELRRHVRAAVPDDLVPQTFVELDALPRRADGSVDRAALPNPFAAEEAAVGPRTEMESAIAELWKDLLGVDSVGVHDNFFDIGGHSLLSVRLISRLDRKVGVRLQHEHLAVNTLEQLAAKCEQMLAAAAPQGVAPANAAAPAEAAKPRGLFGAVKQAVMGSRST